MTPSAPAISFPPPAEHHHHRAVSLHPDFARLVTEEWATPPPPPEEELKLEVHPKDPTASLMFLVSASSLPAHD
jgi:hypothetical protein